jgi:hypothetical protein
MSLTPRERFQMLRQMTERVQEDEQWTAINVNTLLQQYGLSSIGLGDNWIDFVQAFARTVGAVSDETLVAIYATILDIDEEDARSEASVPDDYGLWTEGHVRVFLSHSATEKEFVSEVSRELAVVGVHGFVAHETMQIERPWQAQIEVALRTAEAFVGFVHPRFNESPWCHQELGWAYGRGLQVFLVRFGANPEGFAAATQWPSGSDRTAKDVSHDIVAWLERTTDFTDRIVEGLMAALDDASDYYSAEAAAKRIVALGSLTEGSWAKLARAFWANDQVHGGVLPTRVLQPFYRENGKDWPPPKPAPPLDPWAVDAHETTLSSEAPF